MLTHARPALLAFSLCAALAAPATAEQAAARTGCIGVDDAVAICGGTWRSVPARMAEGISVWTDGEVTAKIIVQPSTLAAQIAAEDVLNLAVESVAASLPGGITLEIESGDVDALGGALFATLSYTLNNASQAIHFRHAILVEDERILQFITAASQATIDSHYQRLMSSLSLGKAAKTI